MKRKNLLLSAVIWLMVIISSLVIEGQESPDECESSKYSLLDKQERCCRGRVDFP